MGRLGLRHWVATALAVLGLAVAVYLTLYQAKVLGSVWDPFSLGGSGWILRRSPLVRWLGFPDAAIGAAAYAAELGLDAAGAGRSSGAKRWAAAALGAIAAAMAVGSLGLVILQGVFGRWCSLCLVSAAASVGIAALLSPEIFGIPALVRQWSGDRGGDRRRDATAPSSGPLTG